MSNSKKSNQDIKTADFQELNSIKSKVDSKIKEVNELLRSAQDKGVSVSVKNTMSVIDDSLLTERHYSLVEINLSLQI